MEWYRKSDGEVVFGEIAARPPGAHTVDTMNFASDIDLFTGWAEAVVHGWMQQLERHYNVGAIFKRAQGAGRILTSKGWTGSSPSSATPLPSWTCYPSGRPARLALLGDRRRDHVVRHPEFQRVVEMTGRFAAEVHMYAN